MEITDCRGAYCYITKKENKHGLALLFNEFDTALDFSNKIKEAKPKNVDFIVSKANSVTIDIVCENGEKYSHECPKGIFNFTKFRSNTKPFSLSTDASIHANTALLICDIDTFKITFL